MGIQVFGKSKCFDTKKALRFFKERGIKVQYVDIVEIGFSPREFDSVLKALGGPDSMVNTSSKSPEYDLYRYLSSEREKEDKLWDHPELIKTPIVRNGKLAAVGDAPEVWKTWI